MNRKPTAKEKLALKLEQDRKRAKKYRAKLKAKKAQTTEVEK